MPKGPVGLIQSIYCHLTTDWGITAGPDPWTSRAVCEILMHTHTHTHTHK